MSDEVGVVDRNPKIACLDELIVNVSLCLLLSLSASILPVSILLNRFIFLISYTAVVAEWLREWDTLTMFEATVCGRS